MAPRSLIRSSRGNDAYLLLRHRSGLGPSATLVLALLLFPFFASATSPRVTGIIPTGAQRGAELELRFNGSRLDDSQEIIFYEPGIQVLNLDAAKTNVLKAQIKIAADCPLGEHHLRIRTAGGV